MTLEGDTLGPEDEDTFGPRDTLEADLAGAATLGADTSRRRPGTALTSGELVDRYVVLSKLGAGAMGVVYGAYDPELDRKVALKLLRFVPGSNQAEGRARLLREAQALAKFTHPEIVTVHDVGEHEGAVWLAMEFVDGHTLGDWIERVQPSWKQVLAVMLAVGRGVAAAHAAGMVHRDLKPDNIMVGHDGRVRVMDFGLTRPQSELGSGGSERHGLQANADTQITEHGSLVGTPAYMAPEQFEGRDASAATDQFGYCVTLWEALYGQRPFAGDTILEVVNMVLEGKLRPAPKGRSVPSWLRRVCERGLARAPAQRWPSMAILLAELERGQARVRRRRLALGLGLVASLAAGAEGARRYDRAQRIAACEAEGAGIDEVWNDEARSRVRAGLLATEVPFAAMSADKLMPYLDERASAWRDHRTRACRNTEVEQTWTAATFDRAVWCLDERRLEFESLIGELAHADVQVARLAVSNAASLTALEPCVDEFVLRNLPEAPAGASRVEVVELRTELARASTLLAATKIPEGLEVIRPLRIAVESAGWPPLVAAAHQREGELLQYAGEYPAAEAMSLAAYVEAAKASVWEVAADAAIDLIWTVGDGQARLQEGRVWAKHAEVAIAHAGDPLGLREAKRSTNLGHVELRAGEYARAERCYQAALDLWTEALGPNHPMLATGFNNLGAVHRMRLEYDRATTDYQRALTLREQVLGPDHPDVAGVLHNLGIVLDAQGEHETAMRFYARALATWDRSLGPGHPNSGATLTAIGLVHYRRGEFEQAKHFYGRALTILETTLGLEHPDVATLLNNLAALALDQREFEQAKALHRRALAIREQALGADHPSVALTLFNLAMVHRVLGEDADALPLLERSLPISERIYGKDHPEVAWALAEIAETKLALGQPNEALIGLAPAMVIFDAHEGEQGGEATARFTLARALVATGGDRQQAIRQAERALIGYRETEQPEPAASVERWLAERAQQ